jgi:hypothetical protein
MVSPTMTEDVDDQLGISAISPCFRCCQLKSSDLSGGLLHRTARRAASENHKPGTKSGSTAILLWRVCSLGNCEQANVVGPPRRGLRRIHQSRCVRSPFPFVPSTLLTARKDALIAPGVSREAPRIVYIRVDLPDAANSAGSANAVVISFFNVLSSLVVLRFLV